MVKRRLWIGGCFFLFLAVAALALIYWSAVSGPRFYRQALQLELVSSRRLGDELEDITLASHNAAIRESMWSISFSDQQLNGWLATHLRNKYPKFYPKGMANLCTSFE
ncbi:MAG: hypothetical protein VX438_04710, partial [Planctomycetota bacterium]|nr:hypothetical protein [Planctomycetota bacterium]